MSTPRGWCAVLAAAGLLSGCFLSGGRTADAGPAPACQAQTRGCAGNTPRLCTDGGWVPQAPCSGQLALCSYGVCTCADGTLGCLDAGPAPACQEGTRSCASGTTPQVCVDGGWLPQPECAGATLLCSTGQCVCPDGSLSCLDAGPAPTCLPATRGCLDGSTPQLCVDGGWVPLAPCAGTEPLCSAGACACTEGAADCISDTPRQCSGGVWQVGLACSGDTPVCDQGACVCADGGVSCQGDTPQLCLGHTFVPQAACAGTTPVCQAGACVCSDGARSCSPAGVPQLCSGGTLLDQPACAGLTPLCSAGTCICADGLGTCSGNTPSICSGGVYWPQTACSASAPLCALGACVRPADFAAASDHACAVVDGGRAACWGTNGSGQLGDGTYSSRASPGLVVAIDLGADGGPDAGLLDQVVSVAVGINSSFALLADGTLAAWGYNGSGQLGIGDGGPFQESVPTRVPGLAGVVQVAANVANACARLADGTVACWGEGYYGGLGNGGSSSSTAPLVVPGLQGVVELAVGNGNQVCARLIDGSVECWGMNYSYQVGTLSGALVYTPTPVAGVSGATALACGGSFSCAVAGGQVLCWGYNGSGQLGPNTSTGPTPTPVPVGLTGAGALAAGDNHACALLGDTTVWCWGADDVGQLGLGHTAGSATPTQVPGLTGVASISAAGSVTCARLTSGALRCWGDDSAGQLGDSHTGNRPAPAPVVGLAGVTAVRAGGNFTCAVVDGGAVACWGSDADGELGTGPGPDQALAGQVPGLAGVASLSAGGFHACALLGDGTVSCWGSNLAGQTQGGSALPALVPGVSGAVQVGASPSQLLGQTYAPACYSQCSDSCALLDGGAVDCWGDNALGQLANGGFGNTQQPPGAALLPGPAGALALGAMHGCALLQDGTVACWGDNASGQLGDGTWASRAAGARVSGLAGATAVVSGALHSCALVPGSGVFCWGDNNYGQLGYCCGNQPLPVQAQVYDPSGAGAVPVSLAAGLYHTCALLSDGTAQCWGDNASGQLGSPYAGPYYPSPVVGLTGAVALTAGGVASNQYGSFTAHTCALLQDGTVSCWGSDRYGQIGDGLFGYVTSPLDVPLP